MDFWIRKEGKSKKDKISNKIIRQKLEIQYEIIYDTQLNNHYVVRISQYKISKKILKWNLSRSLEAGERVEKFWKWCWRMD